MWLERQTLFFRPTNAMYLFFWEVLSEVAMRPMHWYYFDVCSFQTRATTLTLYAQVVLAQLGVQGAWIGTSTDPTVDADATFVHDALRKHAIDTSPCEIVERGSMPVSVRSVHSGSVFFFVHFLPTKAVVFVCSTSSRVNRRVPERSSTRETCLNSALTRSSALTAPSHARNAPSGCISKAETSKTSPR